MKSITFTSFGSHEDDLLHGLPEQAQLLYLRGLRRYMDYATAIVGGSARRISLLMFCELIEVFPHQGMKGVRPDKSKVRRLLGWLERVGLIERIEDKDGYLVYFLPLAKNDVYIDAPSSVQNKPDAKQTQRRRESKPNSDAVLNMVDNAPKTEKTKKLDTHLISNIKQIQTTTTTDELIEISANEGGCGGGEICDDQIGFNPKPAHQPEQQQKTASWEENLIFPAELKDGDKKAMLGHLNRCPHGQRQAVIDELAARKTKVNSPVGYVRKLVDCVLRGEFIPEAGLPLAEARKRHKNDFQTVLPTRRPEPTDVVKAEIARLTAEMVAAQGTGDFKRYSMLGAQIGRLG